MKNRNNPADRVDKMILSDIVLFSASILYFAVHIGYWIIRDTM